MYRLGKGKINAYSGGSQPGRGHTSTSSSPNSQPHTGIAGRTIPLQALSWSVASPLPTPYRTLYHRVCIVSNLPLATLEKSPQSCRNVTAVAMLRPQIRPSSSDRFRSIFVGILECRAPLRGRTIEVARSFAETLFPQAEIAFAVTRMQRGIEPCLGFVASREGQVPQQCAAHGSLCSAAS